MSKSLKEIFRERDLTALNYWKDEPTNKILKTAIEKENAILVSFWVCSNPDIVSHSMWLLANQYIYDLAEKEPTILAQMLGEKPEEKDPTIPNN